jgi:hypothetical protein
MLASHSEALRTSRLEAHSAIQHMSGSEAQLLHMASIRCMCGFYELCSEYICAIPATLLFLRQVDKLHQPSMIMTWSLAFTSII